MPVVSRPPVIVMPRASIPYVAPRVVVVPSFSRPSVAPRVVAPAPFIAPRPVYVAPRPAYAPPTVTYAPPPVIVAPQPKVPLWRRIFQRKPKPPVMAAAPVYGEAQPAYAEPAYAQPVYAPPAAAPLVVSESHTSMVLGIGFALLIAMIAVALVFRITRKD